MSNQWRRCSACKQPIALGADHYVCSVSTCNRKRTGMVFCSVSCWEVHLPVANHRKAWAIDAKAPTTAEEPGKPETPKREARRTVVRDTAPSPTASDGPREILIVASRLKDYIRARADFNTSERALAPLSDLVRLVCDEAIENARRAGRRTVLDRDIPSRR